MKLRTGDLTGPALDWAVARSQFTAGTARSLINAEVRPYSTNWTHGGPLIERDMMQLEYRQGAGWIATRIEGSFICVAYGPTQLIAAMRCYVLARLGSEVDAPDDRSLGG